MNDMSMRSTTPAARIDNAAEIELRIGGMDCPHCPANVEEALLKLDGVSAAHVNPASRSAHVVYDRSQIRALDLIKAIRAAGYTVGTATMRVHIKNMHCSSCVIRIELALQTTPGLIAAQASAFTNAVDVEYLPERTDFAAIRAAIESVGYRVAEPEKAAKLTEEEATDPEEAARQAEYALLMRKFWFAAAVSLPVMLLSYPDLVPGLRDWMPMGSATRRAVWALLGVLSLPVLVWSGSQFFIGMWDGLKHRSANMHTLIAIGISAAYLYSAVAVAFPGLFPRMELAEVFWDVTTVVVALVVLGLALEIKAKGRTSEAIKKLIGLQAKTARVLRDGKELDLPVEEVLVGDTVIIRPGGGQERRWPDPARRQYQAILSRAARVEVVSPGAYASWKFERRNEWMVDHADRIAALWSGPPGGTARCVAYARQTGKPLDNIWPRWRNMATAT